MVVLHKTSIRLKCLVIFRRELSNQSNTVLRRFDPFHSIDDESRSRVHRSINKYCTGSTTLHGEQCEQCEQLVSNVSSVSSLSNVTMLSSTFNMTSQQTSLNDANDDPVFPQAKHFVSKVHFHHEFSSRIRPVLTVEQDDNDDDGTSLIHIETNDCFHGKIQPGSLQNGMSPAELLSIIPIQERNPVTGPVYIRGAEPGDILAVSDFGRYSADRDWRGLLWDVFGTAMPLDEGATKRRYWRNINH
jgi:Acetamidase/Formamidase family